MRLHTACTSYIYLQDPLQDNNLKTSQNNTTETININIFIEYNYVKLKIKKNYYRGLAEGRHRS